jgi:signal transduction histidine kinase/CheY-like chemotaxis protein
LVLIGAQVGVALQLTALRRTELVQVAGARLEAIVCALGPERDSQALRDRLTDLRASGITGLRTLEYDDEELVERESELIFRSGGVELTMSLASVESELSRYRERLLLAGLLLTGLACGVVGLFMLRNRTVRAAERVDVYARRLERQNEELFEAKRRAESADRAKTEFLANVSHELRTPLTAILGFTDFLIENGALSRPHLEDAQTIRRNGHYLYRLLAGLLDFSNLEAGRLRVDWVPCDPAEILNDVESLNRPQVEAKGLRFRTEIADDVPECITSDSARIRQILAHLVENAIKFTDEGSVSLRLSVLREGYAVPQVAFDVIDTGIGMSSEQRKQLFDSFCQGDGSRARHHGGLGLGLALGRRLARLLRGDLTAVSTPREGSAFRLMLPVEPPADVRDELADEEPLASVELPAGCHVLVVEDGADNRKLIDRILRRAGALVTLVDNGREAVELASAAWEDDEPFDAILMDMQMPGIDGLTATQALRMRDYPGVIIALTADARAQNRQECLRAGCDEFLPKPIERERLLASIRALVKDPE